ncbi:hypothetical protein BH20CHL3_BH20CHL3_10970 [soil metagenome]
MADRPRASGNDAKPASLRPVHPVRRRSSPARNCQQPRATPPVLLPLIGFDDELDAPLERTLHPVAMRAQGGDWVARDALYSAFEPKLARIARRIRTPWVPDGCKGVWDKDDVAQEAYLAFVGVIENWPPGIPFGRYVLAHFPWRLRDAVYRGVGRRGVPPRTYAVPIVAGEEFADRASVEFEQRIVIDALASSFEPPLDGLLRMRILEQQSVACAAERLGISQHSATRHWRSLLIRLRADERRQG